MLSKGIWNVRNLKKKKRKRKTSVLPSYIYLVSLGCVHFDSWNFVIYPLRKVVCKFCLSCWGLPNLGAPCCVLGTIRKQLMSKGVMRVFFRLVEEELLNIEQFFHWKFSKIKKKNIQGIEANFYYQCLFLEILSVNFETPKKEKERRKRKILFTIARKPLLSEISWRWFHNFET